MKLVPKFDLTVLETSYLAPQDYLDLVRTYKRHPNAGQNKQQIKKLAPAKFVPVPTKPKLVHNLLIWTSFVLTNDTQMLVKINNRWKNYPQQRFVPQTFDRKRWPLSYAACLIWIQDVKLQSVNQLIKTFLDCLGVTLPFHSRPVYTHKHDPCLHQRTWSPFFWT